MGMRSLRSGLLLLRNPSLWIAPFVSAVFACFHMSLAFDKTGVFYSQKLGIILLFIFPFLLSATYGCIKNEDYSISSYIRQGISGYFRVIIPGILLFFIGILLLFIASMPVVAGAGSILTVFLTGLIFVPFILLTFFYDTAAVFEDKKVFESIKRSIELSSLKTAEIISFYAVMLLLLLITGLGLMILWSGLMTEQLMPLVDMTESEINSLAGDPEAFMEIIGDYGLWVTSLLYSAGVFISVLIILPYKAAFYRDVLADAMPEEGEYAVTGEYDEKGRWYKYS